MKYFLGEYYRYPNSTNKFKLKAFNGRAFSFECGHWCTDNVFIDLIRVKTGKQVYKDLQTELFVSTFTPDHAAQDSN